MLEANNLRQASYRKSCHSLMEADKRKKVTIIHKLFTGEMNMLVKIFIE